MMDKKHSIAYLLTLQKTLDDLMGESMLGSKYTRAIQSGIESLANEDLEVESNKYTVKVLEHKGNIYVQVYFTEGGLIETHEYLVEDLIDEDSLGEA
jgi:hypothetical protein